MNALMKAFENEPRTMMVQENGQTRITVLASHLEPEMAQGCVFLAKFLPSLSLCLGVSAAVITQDPEAMFVPLVGSIIGFVKFPETFKRWARVTTKVTFTESTITAERPTEFVTPPAPMVFDRQHPHRFVLYPHDKARAERDSIDFLARSRPHAHHERYYEHSFFVVLEYFGQRFDLAEVFGEREARAILDRLNLCDSYMSGIANASQRLPTRPEDEWSGPTSSVPR